MSSDRLYQVTPNSWLVQLFNSPEIMEIIDFFNDFLAVFLPKNHGFCPLVFDPPSCGSEAPAVEGEGAQLHYCG